MPDTRHVGDLYEKMKIGGLEDVMWTQATSKKLPILIEQKIIEQNL